LLTLTSCGGDLPPGGGAEASAEGDLPPVDVQVLEIVPEPIPDVSEFIATIRSLRSATVQPQAEGIVRRIFVQSGDRVAAGQPLMQIDPEKQEALLENLQSLRAAREAELTLARRQLERMRSLAEDGVVSRQELDLAEATHETAEAQLRSIESQIRESQVELRYYQLTAPASGILGDLAVREGDRVTRDTVVTTIDESEGLEAYIHVPLEMAPRLRIGLPVELIDSDGAVAARNAVTFIAPRADDSTQTLLVKSLLRAKPPGVRVLQYQRVRVIWSEDPGIRVPIAAVTRVSGQHFVFALEEREGGGYTARQRPVLLGPLTDRSYSVRSGLAPGERIVASNLQKISDGALVRVEE
jgi:RND family efflux transporter MFP subunit